MLYVASVFAMLSLISGPPEQRSAIVQSGNFPPGKSYSWAISFEDLRAAPVWKEGEENPPLSARKAIRLADQLRGDLVKDTERYKWELEYAALFPTGEKGQWYWLIRYEPRSRLGGNVFGYLDLAVLMDGKVVKPTIKDGRP
jgi:hypothetical protein